MSDVEEVSSDGWQTKRSAAVKMKKPTPLKKAAASSGANKRTKRAIVIDSGDEEEWQAEEEAEGTVNSGDDDDDEVENISPPDVIVLDSDDGEEDMGSGKGGETHTGRGGKTEKVITSKFFPPAGEKGSNNALFQKQPAKKKTRVLVAAASKAKGQKQQSKQRSRKRYASSSDEDSDESEDEETSEEEEEDNDDASNGGSDGELADERDYSDELDSNDDEDGDRRSKKRKKTSFSERAGNVSSPSRKGESKLQRKLRKMLDSYNETSVKLRAILQRWDRTALQETTANSSTPTKTSSSSSFPEFYSPSTKSQSKKGASEEEVGADTPGAGLSSQQIDEVILSSLQQPAYLSPPLRLQHYQLIGVNYLGLLHREGFSAILADEMGLGKTVQAAVHLANLQLSGDDGPFLVVVPASVLDNWARELRTWAPFLLVHCYRGSMAERQEQQKVLLNNPDDFHVILTTYTACSNQKLDQKFLRRLSFSVMVLDEAHCLKNITSTRYLAISQLKAQHALILTGTPIQNNLAELAALLSLVIPSGKHSMTELLGMNLSKEELIEKFKYILAPFILRRLKSQVLLEMVPKQNVVVECDMTPRQADCYAQIIATTKAKLTGQIPSSASSSSSSTSAAVASTTSRASGSMDDAIELLDTPPSSPSPLPSSSSSSCVDVVPVIPASMLKNVLMQLRKAANHPLMHRLLFTEEKLHVIARELIACGHYRHEEKAKLMTHLESLSDFQLHEMCSDTKSLHRLCLSGEQLCDSGKIQSLKKLLFRLRDEGHRVLLFSQFTQLLDLFGECVELWDLPFLRVDGSTPIEERQPLIDRFNKDPLIPIFLLSTKAGGLGINLTGADTVVTYDMDFNPHNDKQAEDRVHRIGQTKPVTVYRLISKNTVDRHMLALADAKRDLDEAMLAAPQTQKMETKQLQQLVRKMMMDDGVK